MSWNGPWRNPIASSCTEIGIEGCLPRLLLLHPNMKRRRQKGPLRRPMRFVCRYTNDIKLFIYIGVTQFYCLYLCAWFFCHLEELTLTSGLIEPSLLLPSSISCLPNVLKLELPSFPDIVWVIVHTSEKKRYWRRWLLTFLLFSCPYYQTVLHYISWLFTLQVLHLLML